VLADAAAMPLNSYLKHFRVEFDRRVSGAAPVEKKRTARDEYTPAAKAEAVKHGAPSVLDVGQRMGRP
jgi:hypothetical protein